MTLQKCMLMSCTCEIQDKYDMVPVAPVAVCNIILKVVLLISFSYLFIYFSSLLQSKSTALQELENCGCSLYKFEVQHSIMRNVSIYSVLMFFVFFPLQQSPPPGLISVMIIYCR